MAWPRPGSKKSGRADALGTVRPTAAFRGGGLGVPWGKGGGRERPAPMPPGMHPRREPDAACLSRFGAVTKRQSANSEDKCFLACSVRR